jgi:aryl-phospho-beta-D-glucosidase BglC (GH1 family)
MPLLDSLKSKIKAKASESGIPGSSNLTRSTHSSPPLGPDDVFRYRKQRGVNLGSWFVLEQWITPEPFKNAAGTKQADLDIARGKDAKAVLEHHWDTWITDEDWGWIKERGFNSVRLPVSQLPRGRDMQAGPAADRQIGYYHLTQPCPKVLEGTDFESHADVFGGAWQRITKAIEKAGSMGLGVLVGESSILVELDGISS